MILLQGPSDARMERRLRRIFARVGGMKSIKVEVHDGVVELSGESDDLGSEATAATIARRLEGVVYVNSNVTQHSNLRTRLAPAWDEIKREVGSLLSVLPLIAVAIAIFVASLWLSVWIPKRRWLRRLNMNEATAKVVRIATRVSVIITGLVVALKILGVMGIVTSVVGALGLVGVALGLIFKDWVANFIPGLILGWKPPFKAGDVVSIGDKEGTIVRVTARDTILTAVDGEQVRIPNAQVLSSSVTNFSRHGRRRLRIPLLLAPGSDLERARELGVEALKGLRGGVEQLAPFMHTIAILADRIEVEFYAWVDQQKVDFLDAKSAARQAVREALRAGGIRFPALVVEIASPPQAQPASETAKHEDLRSSGGVVGTS